MGQVILQPSGLLPDDEQIEIVRIKLTRKGCSAVVYEWHAADLLLAKWAQTPGEKALEFEIVFGDGNAFVGKYAYGDKTTGRPSLSSFIRRTFKRLCDVSAPILEAECFFLRPPSNLARYTLTHH
jgi:hypothetical protein